MKNYADPGFQFERLMTGGRLDGRHSVVQHENMQLMSIGGFSVLFAADVDAVDDSGRVVEIKSGNPKNTSGRKVITDMLASCCLMMLRTQVMFQMMSSGAHTVVRGDSQGAVLSRVATCSLADMMQSHAAIDRNRWQDNIVAALAQIKAAPISDEFPHVISIADAVVSLQRQPAKNSILPRVEVVSELFASLRAPAAAAAVRVEPDQQQPAHADASSCAPSEAGGSDGAAADGWTTIRRRDDSKSRGGGGRGGRRGAGRGRAGGGANAM